MDCRSGSETDDYIYLDPKLLKCGDTIPKSRAPFQDAIVFVVGGGNYIEYQNLVDFIKVYSVRAWHAFLNFIYDITIDNNLSSYFSKNNRRISVLFTVHPI